MTLSRLTRLTALTAIVAAAVTSGAMAQTGSATSQQPTTTLAQAPCAIPYDTWHPVEAQVRTAADATVRLRLLVDGRTVAEAGTRDTRGVTITAIKRPDGGWHHCTTDSVIGADDLLLITGPTKKAERFASGR